MTSFSSLCLDFSATFQLDDAASAWIPAVAGYLAKGAQKSSNWVLARALADPCGRVARYIVRSCLDYGKQGYPEDC